MKRLLRKFSKAAPAPAQPARATVIDTEETIVINLSGDEDVAPDSVRIEVEATPAAPAPPRPPAPLADNDQTQIWTAGGAVSPAAAAAAPDAYIDVAVTAGLLILTDGPQRGRVFSVRAGRNRIGRAAANDIAIDSGDAAISKENHVSLAADAKNREFFLVPGSSGNLTYIDDQPLLEAREIADKSIIQVGDTKMVFIQLFGNYVDWPGQLT